MTKTSAPNITALKTYLSQIHSIRSHLSSTIGHQINTLDHSLAKISGGKPKATTPNLTRLDEAAASMQSSFMSQIVGSAISATTGVSVPASLTKVISGNSNGMSQGQVLADLAQAISKASQRNL